MKDKSTLKVGIFSGYDPRPWVMEECADDDIVTLEELIGRIRALKEYEIVYPGDELSGYDKLCYTMNLADHYAEVFAREGVAVLINVHQTWTFPQVSQKVITSYINKMRARDCLFVPRIILASIQDTQVPGMVSGMATGGALARDIRDVVYAGCDARPAAHSRGGARNLQHGPLRAGSGRSDAAAAQPDGCRLYVRRPGHVRRPFPESTAPRDTAEG